MKREKKRVSEREKKVTREREGEGGVKKKNGG